MGVELLGHMVIPYSAFWDPDKLLTVDVLFTYLPAGSRVLIFPYPHQYLLFSAPLPIFP